MLEKAHPVMSQRASPERVYSLISNSQKCRHNTFTSLTRCVKSAGVATFAVCRHTQISLHPTAPGGTTMLLQATVACQPSIYVLLPYPGQGSRLSLCLLLQALSHSFQDLPCCFNPMKHAANHPDISGRSLI